MTHSKNWGSSIPLLSPLSYYGSFSYQPSCSKALRNPCEWREMHHDEIQYQRELWRTPVQAWKHLGICRELSISAPETGNTVNVKL